MDAPFDVTYTGHVWLDGFVVWTVTLAVLIKFFGWMGTDKPMRPRQRKPFDLF